MPRAHIDVFMMMMMMMMWFYSEKLHPKGFFASLLGKEHPTDAFTGMNPASDLSAMTDQAKQVRGTFFLLLRIQCV